MLATYGLKLKKARNGKSRRQESIVFASTDKKVEFYTFTHHKIKNQYRNGDFKNVCDMLFEMEPPQKKQIPLFYQDQLTSLNKYMKSLIHRKEMGSDGIIVAFRRGKEVVNKFYQLFQFEDSVQSSTKSVNKTLESSMTRFLNVFSCFLMYLCYVHSRQGINGQSSPIYDILQSVLRSIVTSSTYNYKILNKAGQGLLLYASLLIDSGKRDKALEAYYLGLKNEINILLILAYRTKHLAKHQSKRLVSKIYDRLIAIMLNIGQVYQIEGRIHLTAFCLRECLIITDFKNNILEKDAKNNLLEYLKHYELFHQQHQQILHIISSYFGKADIKPDQLPLCSRSQNVTEHQEKISSFPTGILSQKTGFSLAPTEQRADGNSAFTKQRRLLKKSYSIQDKLGYNISSNHPLTMEMLFYGVKLFNKMEARARPKSITTTQNNLFLSQKQLISENHPKVPPKPLPSKLTKKTKKHEFRQERQPIDFSTLQKRFARMWNQDEVEVNRIKEKICLLNYKHQNCSYDTIYRESSNVFLQIQPSLKKSNQTNLQNKSSPSRLNHQSPLSESGINLFKSILLKNGKVLGLRRPETLTILKRKVNDLVSAVISDYSSAEESVTFLRKKLELRKEKGQAREVLDASERPEGVNRFSIEAAFLTKDTVEIPNLFLSYITRSSSFSQEILQAILKYGLLLVKLSCDI